MRIARILGAFVFLLVISQPLFAICATCDDNGWGWWDCQQYLQNTGCKYEVDGCSNTFDPCEQAHRASWKVASVEIRRVPSSDRAGTAVAVAALQPSANPQPNTR